ncbi:MAG: acyl-CoA dehydrogenase family protein [Bacteroidota bacterium]
MKGGAFLTEPGKAKDIFIPEEWNEEQIMIADTVIDFIVQNVHPVLDELDEMKDPNLMPELLELAGELGLTGITIPEKYGGLDLDFNTSLLFGEVCASGFCFATTLGAQTSIGCLPIVYYGSDYQKEKYLPGIATGQIKAAYCLTEPGAGSDANSGKSRAMPSKNGNYYILNGQKMWITNGGFADVFIVFAKIEDDENLSAFIVEKDFGGVELGAEEKKLGIKGSSTCQVFFNDCPVPKENLLSERGKGFRIALNILNSGRVKLAAGSIGGSKMGIDRAVKYANERKQFGKSIGEFGAIKYKLAQMATRTFASESALYKIGKAVDERSSELVKEGKTPAEAKLQAVREWVVECALMKVHGSEVVDYVVDETMQIFGGMGYSAETGIERAYRDARITRIYEGTSEINRLLAVGELFKKAFKTKDIDIVSPAKKLPTYILKNMLTSEKGNDLATAKKKIQNLKNVFLLLAATTGKKFGLKLIDEQEIIMNLSDILAEIYVAECVWLRVEKLSQKPDADAAKNAIKLKMAQVYLYDAIRKVNAMAREVVQSYAAGSTKQISLWAIKRLTSDFRINPKNLRREIAEYMLDQDGFPFSEFRVSVGAVSSKPQPVSS